MMAFVVYTVHASNGNPAGYGNAYISLSGTRLTKKAVMKIQEMLRDYAPANGYIIINNIIKLEE